MKPETVDMTAAGTSGAGVATEAKTLEWDDEVKLATSGELKGQRVDITERALDMLDKYAELSGGVKDYLRRDALNMEQVSDFLSKDGITVDVSNDGKGYRFNAADGESMQFYFGDDLATFSFMDKDGKLISNVQERASGDFRTVLVGDGAVLDVEKSNGDASVELNDYEKGMNASAQAENGKYNMEFSDGDGFETSIEARKGRASFVASEEHSYKGSFDVNLRNKKLKASYEDFNDNVYVEGELNLKNEKAKAKVIENVDVLDSGEGDFAVSSFSVEKTNDGYDISAKTVRGEREEEGRRIRLDEVTKTDVSVSGDTVEIKSKDKDFVMKELNRAKEMLGFLNSKSETMETATVENDKKESTATTKEVAKVSTSDIMESLSDRYGM